MQRHLGTLRHHELCAIGALESGSASGNRAFPGSIESVRKACRRSHETEGTKKDESVKSMAIEPEVYNIPGPRAGCIHK